ncbi:hypothetical protein GCM10017714_13100 [Curtobacterium pusillum]|uniref:DUF4190 domain-containing protein n=1 Tax=Curtobacterium pusillum TaxID=69373 RepID=A0ABX2M5D5_9MICO|nr:hypothetical protein [Curtobacterium pusillum]NUU13150.1 hypothetical protein [Curtobacterium pusillum]GLK30571.1 hypothetical protein GCM10017610_08560 [Curtobacterium pusillum]
MSYSPPPQYPYQPMPGAYGQQPGNGLAVAALVLGIFGFLVTWVPFFIGLLLGGVPDVLAIILGICGIVRANRVHRGMGMAVTGLVLGGLAFISIFLGAGTVW